MNVSKYIQKFNKVIHEVQYSRGIKYNEYIMNNNLVSFDEMDMLKVILKNLIK